jgi:hypothetical protein
MGIITDSKQIKNKRRSIEEKDNSNKHSKKKIENTCPKSA